MEKLDTIIILHKNIDRLMFKKIIFKNLKGIEEYIELGIRRFAYIIQGEEEGFYIEIKWIGNTQDISKLEKWCQIYNGILKYITVKREV